MGGKRRLQVLFEEVQTRTSELMRAHPGWPCAHGCGACCRSLARVPELTRAEWELLEEALQALHPSERLACMEAARTLAAEVRERGPERSCQCPFFDSVQESCRVYEARPLACRTYGFYAGGSHDAWCKLVTAHVTDVRDTLVLGNLDASERELSRDAGPRQSLLAWLGVIDPLELLG